jgi:hypothetical protein
MYALQFISRASNEYNLTLPLAAEGDPIQLGAQGVRFQSLAQVVSMQPKAERIQSAGIF